MTKYKSDTGLELDDTVPDDLKILERQRAAARAAGTSGGDRAGTTRGRADLASAFDAGTEASASAPATPPAAAGAKTGKPAAAGRGKASKSGARKAADGTVAAVKDLPAPTLKPPRSLGSKDMGGFALGLVLQALVVSYIRYGSKGPTGWLKAKFLNKPIQGDDLDPGGPDTAEGQFDPTKPII